MALMCVARVELRVSRKMLPMLSMSSILTYVLDLRLTRCHQLQQLMFHQPYYGHVQLDKFSEVQQ